MMYLKIASLILFLFGEALCIWSEMLAAKSGRFWHPFLWITIAGIPLLLGYILGLKAFGSIWIVSIMSIVAVIISEPILIWVMFKEPPSRGAIAGFVLGVTGLYLTTNY